MRGFCWRIARNMTDFRTQIRHFRPLTCILCHDHMGPQYYFSLFINILSESWQPSPVWPELSPYSGLYTLHIHDRGLRRGGTRYIRAIQSASLQPGAEPFDSRSGQRLRGLAMSRFHRKEDE